jgi:hypothetical protein
VAERFHLGGLTNTTLHVESDGTLHIEEKLDAEPILDWTKACRDNRFSAEDTLDGMARYEGEVPVTIYLAECKKRGMDHHTAMRTLGTPEGDIILMSILYDPLYAKLRAAPSTRDAHVIVKGAR